MILIFGHAEESTAAAARSWERLENFSFHVRATWYSVHNRYTERLTLCMTVMRSPWHMSCVLICLFCVRGLVSAYCLVPSYPAELLHTPFLTNKQHERLWMTRSHRPPWFQWRALLQRCLTMTCSNLYWSLQTICRRQGWLFQICVSYVSVEPPKVVRYLKCQDLLQGHIFVAVILFTSMVACATYATMMQRWEVEFPAPTKKVLQGFASKMLFTLPCASQWGQYI